MVESNNNNQFYIQYRTPINNVVAKSIVNANKQKNAKSLTEANLEKIRKKRREWARKRVNSMTEADKEAKRQRKREWYRKRREKKENEMREKNAIAGLKNLRKS